jgi:hypothetical protein
VAWLFAAEDQAVMAAGFGELAAQLGTLDPLDPRKSRAWSGSTPTLIT